LPPGGRLVFSKERLIEGPCCLASIDLLPGFTEVNITAFQPNGKITVAPGGPNSLTVANTSNETVAFVEVTWRVKE
jgi:hypothetical protein